MVPKFFGIFMWRIRQGRIPCRAVLDKMGMDIPSVLCPRCEKEVETIDHALVKCQEGHKIWKEMFRWWKIDKDRFDSLNEVLVHPNSAGGNGFHPSRWTDAVWTFLYLIWGHRNSIVFKRGNKRL